MSLEDEARKPLLRPVPPSTAPMARVPATQPLYALNPAPVRSDEPPRNAPPQGHENSIGSTFTSWARSGIQHVLRGIHGAVVGRAPSYELPGFGPEVGPFLPFAEADREHRPAGLTAGDLGYDSNLNNGASLGHPGMSAADLQAWNAGGVGAAAKPKKKWAQGVRSWIRIQASGECDLVEADKSAIMKRCELPGRDLRLLDPLFVYPSTILGREKAIVVNLENLRCIITADEVLLLNSSDPVVQQYKSTLRLRLLLGSSAGGMGTGPSIPDFNGAHQGVLGLGAPHDDDELPFEFKALELALEMACSALESQAQALTAQAYPVLEKLAFHISTTNLEMVRRIKSRLLSLTRRVQKVRDEVEQLMDDDGDMAEMHLTDKRLRAEASAALRSSSRWDSHLHSSGVVAEPPSAAASPRTRRGSGGVGAAAVAGGADPWGRTADGASVSGGSVGGFGSVSYSAPASPTGSPPRRTGGGPRGGSSREGQQGGGVVHGLGGPPLEGRGSLNWGAARSRASEDSSADGVSAAPGNVETLEMLLEAYFVQIEGSLNKLTHLSQYIDDTEDFINIQLDNVRNQLIQFELLMTTGAFVVALMGVVAGVFGMNVPLGLEEDSDALPWILLTTGAGGALIFLAFLAYFKYKNWTG